MQNQNQYKKELLHNLPSNYEAVLPIFHLYISHVTILSYQDLEIQNTNL